MMRTISILLALTVFLVPLCADSSSATLNLATSVTGDTKVAVITGSAVPETFPESSDIIGDTPQTVSPTSSSFTFVIETNQSVTDVTIQANPLVMDGNYIVYQVTTVGTEVSKATSASGDAVSLLSDSSSSGGRRIVGASFSVQAVDLSYRSESDTVFGYNVAPAGTYFGSVTISYTAS